MSAADGHSSTPARTAGDGGSERLRRLAAEKPARSADAFVASLDLAAHTPGERPYVMLNMVSTADGRASIDGRSSGLSSSADRELFHALRAVVDGVLAGAGTIRAERYGRMIRDAQVRRARVERGLPAEPLACIVSGQLALPSDVPLLAEREARVAILTPSPASLTGVAAHVEYVRAERDGALDLPRALAQLGERFGISTLLGEGGPHLNGELLAAGLVDELFLSLSPKLAGGEDASGESLRIVAGAELGEPRELELLGALESESHLFLRYRVRDAAR
jgi:riboflavin-specific deaminase-like protein